MKAFIIAAISLDGFIAHDKHQSSMSWTSQDDKRRFVELTKRAGVIVVGSTTFKTFPRPLKDRLNIVYSQTHQFTGENVETTEEDPAVLLEKLAARGFKEVAICGGSQIYNIFLKAGSVDRIYLTIEPIIFGKGVPLFAEGFDQTKLELVSSETTTGGSVLLEYNVKSK